MLYSTGGYFIVNEDRNTISQLYCTYKTAHNRSFRFDFAFSPVLKLHVTDRFPASSGEVLFTHSGKLSCSALNELSTPDKPSCRATITNLLITNQIDVVEVSDYPLNLDSFGDISYKSTTSIPEFTGDSDISDDGGQLIKPRQTIIYPVFHTSLGHGISVSVRVFENFKDVTDLCISKWLPEAQLLVKYGAFPHIIISGQVGTDGNPKSDFKCELRCNEKEEQKDCWDVWFYEKVSSFLTHGDRKDLSREYMLAETRKAYGMDFSEKPKEVLLRLCQAIPYFNDLGLKPGATFKEAKKAYRALSRQLHPDKIKDHEDRQ